ncbi:MAG: DUF6498-containing protein [Pseudomonadota bacterium]
MNIARSSLLLVLVNLLPVVGVIWLDWSVLEIMLLYWTESIIIGAVNVLRMLSSRTVSRLQMTGASVGDSERSSALASSKIGLKLFLIPFFAMHFGMFCFGHLMAILFVFSGDAERLSLNALPPASDTLFWLAAAAILLSHLFSYLVNFIGKGEYRRVALPQLMRQPYGRIVVMHITVIVGAALIDWLDSPVPMLVFLVAVKTVVDLRMHRRERRRFDGADATELSSVPL